MIRKLYAVSIIAFKNQRTELMEVVLYQATVYHLETFAVTAYSLKDATVAAQAQLDVVCPKADGWFNHAVKVCVIPENIVAKVAPAKPVQPIGG